MVRSLRAGYRSLHSFVSNFWVPTVIGELKSTNASQATLQVLFFGRTGNLFIQLENAIAVAGHFGVGQILIESNSHFPKKRFFVDGVRILNGNGILNLVLQSFTPFRYQSTFYKLDDFVTLVPQRADDAIVRELRRNMRLDRIAPIDSDALVIHMRGGDIFYAPEPHPGYGQPPLAYYKRVLGTRNWTRVFVVTEPVASPALEPLIQFIVDNDFGLVLVSGDEKEALSHLVEAENLCIGNSTFGVLAARISTNLKTLFLFDILCENMDLENADIVRVVDSPGEYQAAVLRNNWKGSREQIRLLLNYPVGALELESVARQDPI